MTSSRRSARRSAWTCGTRRQGLGALYQNARERRGGVAEARNAGQRGASRELAKKQEQSSSEESDSDESREELIAKPAESFGSRSSASASMQRNRALHLLNMKFMVKAREAQRARAREDAEKLLEELEADRSGSDDDDDEDGAALRELAALSGDAPSEPEAPPTIALQGNSLKVRRKRGAAAAAAAPAAALDGARPAAGGAEAPSSGGEGAWLAAARKARARAAAPCPRSMSRSSRRDCGRVSVTQAPEAERSRAGRTRR